MTHQPIHVLVYGFSGSMKTTLAASFPAPIYVCMFDAMGQDEPFVREGDRVERSTSVNGVPIKRVFLGKKLIAELHFYHDVDETRPNAWDDFTMEQKLFVPTDWATWVGDSVTEAAEAALFEQQYHVGKTLNNPMLWRAGATDQMSVAFKTRLKRYDCNVVVCAHIAQKYVNIPSFSKGQPSQRVDKRIESAESSDDGAATLVRGLAAPGRLARDGGLMSQFQECYRSYVTTDEKGKHHFRLQTENDGDFIAKTQIPAPDGCEPHYDALWEKRKSR